MSKNYLLIYSEQLATDIELMCQSIKAPSNTLFQIRKSSSSVYANIREANYYLYELDNLDVDGYFSTNATGKELNIVWTPVDSLSENDAILKKGHVYAMQFPYCPLWRQ